MASRSRGLIGAVSHMAFAESLQAALSGGSSATSTTVSLQIPRSVSRPCTHIAATRTEQNDRYRLTMAFLGLRKWPTPARRSRTHAHTHV